MVLVLEELIIRKEIIYVRLSEAKENINPFLFGLKNYKPFAGCDGYRTQLVAICGRGTLPLDYRFLIENENKFIHYIL